MCCNRLAKKVHSATTGQCRTCGSPRGGQLAAEAVCVQTELAEHWKLTGRPPLAGQRSGKSVLAEVQKRQVLQAAVAAPADRQRPPERVAAQVQSLQRRQLTERGWQLPLKRQPLQLPVQRPRVVLNRPDSKVRPTTSTSAANDSEADVQVTACPTSGMRSAGNVMWRGMSLTRISHGTALSHSACI